MGGNGKGIVDAAYMLVYHTKTDHSSGRKAKDMVLA